MQTGKLQISASLHSRYQNADQQKPAELKQEKSFIQKRCYIDVECSLNIYLADVQAYIQPQKVSEKSSQQREREREKQPRFCSLSLVWQSRNWDKKLFCFV